MRNDDHLPVVAIVGRPNVGKSTLFNRLIGRRKALVHDRPGITRDRIAEKADFGDRWVRLVDTGGLAASDEELPRQILEQVDQAVADADVLLIVMDAREGVTPLDEEVVAHLRPAGKKMLVVVNKMDPDARRDTTEFHRLGLGEWVEISAEHGRGIDTLREATIGLLPTAEETRSTESAKGLPTRVLFLGRPNVGKSSIINALLQEGRLIISEKAGTTRDVVDVPFVYEGKNFLLLDSAGLRKRGKVDDAVENLSAMKSLAALERTDIAILVVDGSEGVTTQEEKIASAVMEKGVGLVVAVNKWDLVADSERARHRFRDETYLVAPFLRFAAVRFLSAKTEMGLEGLLSAVLRVKENLRKRFREEELREAFDAISENEVGVASRLRWFGLTRAEERIPTFFVWCSDPRRVPKEIERYWENALGERLALEGVPLRVVFRRKKGSRTTGRKQR